MTFGMLLAQGEGGGGGGGGGGGAGGGGTGIGELCPSSVTAPGIHPPSERSDRTHRRALAAPQTILAVQTNGAARPSKTDMDRSEMSGGREAAHYLASSCCSPESPCSCSTAA